MDYFTIGIVVNTQGLHGELRILPTTDDPARFNLLKNVSLTDDLGAEIFAVIEKIRFHNKFVIIKFKHLDDISMVEKFKGMKIRISSSEALPLSTDEYYVRDLYGLRVFDEHQNPIGILEDVLKTGANDVYSISRQGAKPLLIPAIKACVLEVDIFARKMIISIPEGLD